MSRLANPAIMHARDIFVQRADCLKQPLTFIITASWLVFGVVWLILSRNTKASVRIESRTSRIAHLLPLAISFVLLTEPSSGALPLLRQRFVADMLWIATLGAALTVAGVALAIWARLTLGRNWSATVMQKSGHELITSGPFRYVRHPIYTGMLVAMIGPALAVGEWRGVVAVAISWLALWRKYRLEERYMVELFGSQYQEYRKRVPALIPLPGHHA
jgi:protein-S-isoprenylcysteine O-methyltransferase Ste14